MNSFLLFLIRASIVLPLAMIIWLMSVVIFNQTYFLSFIFSVAGGLLANIMISVIAKNRFLKKHGLTRKEFKYIKRNLEEAKQKITRLHKSLLLVRHFPSLKKRIELMRLTRKIYRLTKKEPKRFYKAERFYFSHLDSAVELTEKYVFLSDQPSKSMELNQTLDDTRQMLDELTYYVQEDLHEMISDDIDQLNFEMDVAKHSINSIKDSSILDESRRLK
ncbi:5-bromo-4-chloroindolyl phosphate hydrolysis family protein [Bacillus sp. 03113]|uniref:5-bromo-4-chloroindolyl phosphate hydrolysis family protein n=1 Tax=Bacillus sp. 03113 TaxID=2578211 RepID=UPI0011434892|nr:5-bromo-4-chloroindolyl phosphate hydrolysis family protein [Bacillus sp. 03113]